jgi:glycosyltransferase involved in cell wall biosynthesis
MKAPKISVVMPAYNAEKYISEAMESILNQTFIDFVLLIVDDGSTDDTVKIIRSYKDSRITLIRNNHEGIVTALNTGFEKVAGKYVARMDADDVMHPQRLEIQYSYMEENSDITVCASWMRVFDDKGTSRITQIHEGYIDNILQKLLKGNIIYLKFPTSNYRI